MSAAFIVCSGIVNTPTVSADSSNTLKVEKLGGIKNVESVHTLKPVSIPQGQSNDKLARQKRLGELTIRSLGFVTPDLKENWIKVMNTLQTPMEVFNFVRKQTEINKNFGEGPKQAYKTIIAKIPNISSELVEKYQTLIQDANSQAELNRIWDQAKKEVSEGDSEKYRHEIDNLSVTGLTMMAEADEIYQKHKNLLHSHYKDSIGTYTNLFTNRGGVTPWVGAEGLKDAQEAFRKAKVLLANLKALQEQIEKTQKKPVAKGTYDVKYVDTEGEEVAKSRHFEGEEGTAFVTSAKEVAGYKLVRTEGDVLNVFTAGAQVRTYVYEKVKPEVKPEAKPATKKSVNTSGNLAAKKAIENKKYSKKLPSTGEAASPLLAIVSLIVMLSAGLITIVLKHKKIKFIFKHKPKGLSFQNLKANLIRTLPFLFEF